MKWKHIDINKVSKQLGYKAEAPPNPAQNTIGIDFLPPMNSESMFHENEKIMVTKHDNVSIPKNFSWRNTDDVNLHHKLNWKSNLLSPNLVQLNCGMCFVGSVVIVLQDRISIILNERSPLLSPNNVLACCNSDKCAGGRVVDAAKYIEEQGCVAHPCWPFEFCSFNPICANGLSPDMQQLNQLIPSCERYGQGCVQCIKDTCWDATSQVVQTRFKIKPNSIRLLHSIEDIRKEIFRFGPVVGTMRIFYDFLLANFPKSKFPLADGWQSTSNIYCHVNIPGLVHNLYDYCTKTECTIDENTSVGNHSMRIVGYGTQVVRNFFNPIRKKILDNNTKLTTEQKRIVDGWPTSETFELPFWEVSQSWNFDWGPSQDGYFKIAVTNPTWKLNVDVGLDIPLNIDGVTFGGCVAFDPDLSWLQEIRPNCNNPPLPQCNLQTLKTQETGLIVLQTLGILLLVAFLLCFIFSRKR